MSIINSKFIFVYIISILIGFWKIVEKFDLEDLAFKYLVKNGVNSKVNKESLIALCLSEKNKKKVHYYEFPIIKETNWRYGAISKYDIPQFFNDIPEEFPPLCTNKEVGTIKNYLIQLKKMEIMAIKIRKILLIK